MVDTPKHGWLEAGESFIKKTPLIVAAAGAALSPSLAGADNQSVVDYVDAQKGGAETAEVLRAATVRDMVPLAGVSMEALKSLWNTNPELFQPGAQISEGVINALVGNNGDSVSRRSKGLVESVEVEEAPVYRMTIRLREDNRQNPYVMKYKGGKGESAITQESIDSIQTSFVRFINETPGLSLVRMSPSALFAAVEVNPQELEGDPVELLEALQSNSYIALIQLDGQVTLPQLALPPEMEEMRRARSANYGALELTNAQRVLDNGGRGEGNIFDFDTGLDIAHSARENNRVIYELCVKECSNGTDFQEGTGAADDDHGHGSGVIDVYQKMTGGTTGVGVIKVGDRNGVVRSSDVTFAIYHIIEQRQNGTLADVDFHATINSYGSGRCTDDCDITQNHDQYSAFVALEQAFSEDGNVDMLHVGAAGNRAYTDGVSAPGGYENFILAGSAYPRDYTMVARGMVFDNCTDPSTEAVIGAPMCPSSTASNVSVVYGSGVERVEELNGEEVGRTGNSLVAPQVVAGYMHARAINPFLNRDTYRDMVFELGDEVVDRRLEGVGGKAEGHKDVLLDVAAIVDATPRHSASPSNPDFGAAEIGETHRQLVTLVNPTNQPISITSEVQGGGFEVSDNCPEIPAQGTCVVEVRFTPVEVGEQEAVVLFTDGNGKNFSIYTSATGEAPDTSQPYVDIKVNGVDNMERSDGDISVSITLDPRLAEGQLVDYSVIAKDAGGNKLSLDVATLQWVEGEFTAIQAPYIPLSGFGLPPFPEGFFPTMVTFQVDPADGEVNSDAIASDVVYIQ